MSLKIVETPSSYTWPCIAHIPRDGGEFTKARFKLEFAMLGQAEIDRVLAAGPAAADPDLMRRVIVGWPQGEICDEQGNPLPFSDENKEKLLDKPYARTAAVDGYFESITGNAARRKNLR